MSRLKILISGGGIAGNALAFWVSKLGHDVTVVERFPALRTTGLQLDLRGHGIEVLKRMGLEPQFREKSAPEQGLQMVDASGRRRAFFPANTSGKGLQEFTTEYEIMRGDFCRLLHDAARERTKYVFGTSIQSYEDKGDAVEVQFADGKTDSFDLVVGADGQGSRMRKMMLGADAADAFAPFGTSYIGYFLMPRPMQDGEEYLATAFMATDRRFIMTRRHSPDALQVYLQCDSTHARLARARPGDVAEEKAALADVFRGAGWQTDAILAALADSDDFYLERLGLVKLDAWSRGRVVLLGDAGYCPSPMTGMGTTSAFVGAYVLAGEIGRHCSSAAAGAQVPAALRAYDDGFRPFMEQVQRGISKDTGNWMPTSAWGIDVLLRCLGVVSYFKFNIFGRFVMREQVKGWELPEYEELKRALRTGR